MVDRAIAYTEHVISTKPEHYRAARIGLQRIRDRLIQDHPDHPALARLNTYLEQLSKRD
jgi:hypothetical protein